jgi:hypothetical protein
LPAIPGLPPGFLLFLGVQRLGIELFDDVQETQLDWEMIENVHISMRLKWKIEYVYNPLNFIVLV